MKTIATALIAAAVLVSAGLAHAQTGGVKPNPGDTQTGSPPNTDSAGNPKGNIATDGGHSPCGSQQP